MKYRNRFTSKKKKGRDLFDLTYKSTKVDLKRYLSDLNEVLDSNLKFHYRDYKKND